MKPNQIVLFLAFVAVSSILLYLGVKASIQSNDRQYQRGFDDAIKAVKFNKKRVFDDTILILKDSIYLDSNLVISKNITFVR